MFTIDITSLMVTDPFFGFLCCFKPSIFTAKIIMEINRVKTQATIIMVIVEQRLSNAIPEHFFD
jgi:hypothetical protein